MDVPLNIYEASALTRAFQTKFWKCILLRLCVIWDLYFDLVELSFFSYDYNPLFPFVKFWHRKVQFSCFLRLVLKRDFHPFSGIEKGHWSNIFSSGVFEPIVHFVTKFKFCLQGLDIMQKSYLEALIFLINISYFFYGVQDLCFL